MKQISVQCTAVTLPNRNRPPDIQVNILATEVDFHSPNPTVINLNGLENPRVRAPGIDELPAPHTLTMLHHLPSACSWVSLRVAMQVAESCTLLSLRGASRCAKKDNEPTNEVRVSSSRQITRGSKEGDRTPEVSHNLSSTCQIQT